MREPYCQIEVRSRVMIIKRQSSSCSACSVSKRRVEVSSSSLRQYFMGAK